MFLMFLLPDVALSLHIVYFHSCQKLCTGLHDFFTGFSEIVHSLADYTRFRTMGAHTMELGKFEVNENLGF